jgi:Sugar transport protein
MLSAVTPMNEAAVAQSRPRKLQALGILSGFNAGAWLGAAEAPTKLVSVGVSPSATQAPAHSMRGVWAALGAGILWGTMYIPYRKAYLSGMNPLSFVTFFTFGELGMMSALAIGYLSLVPLWHELSSARDVLFWLMLGGFIWVIGDFFQQYAAKYVGISRGIPLSNSNQLWGLLWGVFVFGELDGSGASTYMQVVGGSLLMMLGVGAIAFSSAAGKEQAHWQEASQRESRRPHARHADGRRSQAAANALGLDARRGRHWRLHILRRPGSRPAPVFPLGPGSALDCRDRGSASGLRHKTLADHSLQLNPS